jgi:hypothetical protein
MCNLPYLNYLRLAYNNISYIPDCISNDSNLWILDVSYNQLTGISDNIYQLTWLTKLLLVHNNLTNLWTWLWNLTWLNELSIAENQISSLPYDIWNLVNLQALWINDMPLDYTWTTWLIDNTANLSALDVLTVNTWEILDIWTWNFANLINELSLRYLLINWYPQDWVSRQVVVTNDTDFYSVQEQVQWRLNLTTDVDMILTGNLTFSWLNFYINSDWFVRVGLPISHPKYPIYDTW